MPSPQGNWLVVTRYSRIVPRLANVTHIVREIFFRDVCQHMSKPNGQLHTCSCFASLEPTISTSSTSTTIISIIITLNHHHHHHHHQTSAIIIEPNPHLTSLVMADEGAFWDAYRHLGDCYRADLARLGATPPPSAPPAAAPVTPRASKLRTLPQREQRDAVDDELARLQGHKLQQVLFSRAGALGGRYGCGCWGGGVGGWVDGMVGW